MGHYSTMIYLIKLFKFLIFFIIDIKSSYYLLIFFYLLLKINLELIKFYLFYNYKILHNFLNKIN